MTETISETSKNESPKKPAVVILTAILNFISSAAGFIVASSCGMLLAFGNAMGLYNMVTQKLTQMYPQPSLSMSFNALFGLIFAASLCVGIGYLFIGIGLLKGRSLAWYFQIGFFMIGLLGFPIGTIINAVMLALFFQPNIRSYFKV